LESTGQQINSPVDENPVCPALLKNALALEVAAISALVLAGA
jgi:hypothetical protein